MAQIEINFGNYEYYFNNLPYLFTDKGIDPFYLVEDILQIQYGNRCVDLGYYRGKLLIIKISEDSDWQKPLYKKVIRKIEKEKIYKELNKAIEWLNRLQG